MNDSVIICDKATEDQTALIPQTCDSSLSEATRGSLTLHVIAVSSILGGLVCMEVFGYDCPFRPDLWILVGGTCIGLALLRRSGELWDLLCPGPMGMAVVGIIIADAVGALFSIYRQNSTRSCENAYALSLVYLLARIACQRREMRYALYTGVTALSLCLAFQTLIHAFFCSESVHRLEFTDPTVFKILLPGSGHDVTLLLAALPFSIAAVCAKPRFAIWHLYGTALLVAAILGTLSRGAYIAFALLAVMTLIILARLPVCPTRTLVRALTLVVVVASIVICVARLPVAVADTAAMGRSKSSWRSVEGRELQWRRSAALVCAHPITGVGSSNFAIAYLPLAGQDVDIPLTGLSFGVFQAITVERGIIGLIAFGAFWAMLLGVSLRVARFSDDHEARRAAALMAIGFCALICRDLTYTSVFDTPVSSLVAIMAAHNSSLLSTMSRQPMRRARQIEKLRE